jgi:putative transposase
LPHIQPQDATFFITFRLANSLPKQIIIQLLEDREQREKLINTEKNAKKRKAMLEEERRRYFGHFDEYLDRVKPSPHWLAESEVAKMVAEAIKYQDGKQYVLNAFCVLPNHVHMMIDVEKSSAPLYRILQKLKSYTAIQANKILHRSGAFWHHESYDHVVRDGSEFERIVWYILQNPVKAGLCKTWEDWKWSYLKPEYGCIAKQ